MQANYHTHTKRCKHAYGRDEDYVKIALRNGFEELGFSDHTPWKYKRNYRSPMRMKLKEFDSYITNLNRLKEKYQDQIRIRIGLEAEYFPAYMDWLLDLCIENGVEYLIFGNHYLESDEYGPYTGVLPKEKMDLYFDSCVEGMKTGLFSYLAHPELALRNGCEWDEEIAQGFEKICQAAKELDIPLEYNCLGARMNEYHGVEQYPHHLFWEMAARHGCKAIIGMDAHQPYELDREMYDKARAYLEGLGMEIVEEIPLKDFKAIQEQRQKNQTA